MSAEKRKGLESIDKDKRNKTFIGFALGAIFGATFTACSLDDGDTSIVQDAQPETTITQPEQEATLDDQYIP